MRLYQMLGILIGLTILVFDTGDGSPIKYREFFPRGFHMGEVHQDKPVYLVNREGGTKETLQRASRDATLHATESDQTFETAACEGTQQLAESDMTLQRASRDVTPQSTERVATLQRSERDEEETTKIPMEYSSTTEKEEAIASRSGEDMDMEDMNVVKTLVRREDELQLNQIFQEMHKAKGQVEIDEQELRKAEQIAQAALRMFWEAVIKVQEIAAMHVAASEVAAKLANDTMNAQYSVQQRDAVLSQGRQMYNNLNQKYLALQVELLKKASACTFEKQPGMLDGAQNRPQSQGPNPPPTYAGAPPPPSNSTSTSASTPARAGGVATNPAVAVNRQGKANLVPLPLRLVPNTYSQVNLLPLPFQRLVPNIYPQVMNQKLSSAGLVHPGVPLEAK